MTRLELSYKMITGDDNDEYEVTNMDELDEYKQLNEVFNMVINDLYIPHVKQWFCVCPVKTYIYNYTKALN
jgi:hypothetical protein